ncbi:MAG: 4-alpha-glucanotransferase [Chloroflexota bacterium]|nr:4-alpha-glucanotransferase [Chloroflexota bacterium]
MTDMTSRRAERAAGILLHPTSLPGPHGVGDLGTAAYRFVDFLTAGRQTLWQIMPLGPVGLGNSPYASSSAFAGSPLLIALEELARCGWLDEDDLRGPDFPPNRVDYEGAGQFKREKLGVAFERFRERASDDARAALAEFRERERGWLDDYVLFAALKERRDGAWWEWPAELALREPAALDRARRDLSDSVAFQEFVQWVFWSQWGRLRRYANERDIRIVGDIPIFVAQDSADVWAHRSNFHLDEQGQPTVVAGVPPDYFSPTGQRWGNPLYEWDRLAETGYAWWIDRFRATLELVDLIRIDHFRGFQAYWAVPAEEETALNGRWMPGPGQKFFAAVRHALGELPIVVEDLGDITPDVIRLREALGFPGMKVLQFAFGEEAQREVPTGENPYLPHNYEENCVVYSGTHDNDTTVGWYASRDEPERHAVRRYLGRNGDDIAWDFIRLALSSVARYAIVPLQDVLGLGSEARMNVPGQPADNWTWRYREDQIARWHPEALADMTATYGRWQAPEDEDAADEQEEADDA